MPVTIDAMGCPTKIAQKIVDRDADYVLAVKDNGPPPATPPCFARRGPWQASPNLHAEIARAFDDPEMTRLPPHGTLDGEHGRIEQRRHLVIHDVGFISTDRRFPGLEAIAMVETEVERAGRTSRERRFYISSLPLGADLFARAVREHRPIENRLHRVLAVVFHEDLGRLGTGNGLQNMAVVRHITRNLLRGAKDKHSLEV